MQTLLDLGLPVSRRTLIRGTALGAAGLAGAALIGCGGDDDGIPAVPTQAPIGGGESQSTAESTPDAVAPKRGGTLTVDSGTPNPNVLQFGFNTVNRPIQHTVWEQLIGLTPDYQVRNVLAETFELNADSSALHIVLREGVEFHDGRPLTAEDVAASIDFFSNEESSGQLTGPLREGISEVRVADARTLDLTFNGSQPGLIDMFGLMRIIDHNTARAIPEMRNLVGTGPFKFVSFTPDVGYRLERNENYWQPDLPYLDAIEGKLYADAQARELAVRSGELHWTDGVPSAIIARLRNDPNVYTVSRGKGGHRHMGLVVTRPPFDDVRVRQAATFAIDRQRISEEWAEGVAEATALPWPVESPAYSAEEDFPNLVTYDPDRAANLLEEAGVAGASITLQVAAGGDLVDLAQYVQDDLNRVGLRTELVILEASVQLEQLRGREIQSNAWIGQHGFANYMHPGYMVASAQQYQVPNASGYNPEGFEELRSAITQEPVGSPRLAELISQFNRQHVLDDPWLIGLVASDEYRAMHSSVKGDRGGNLAVLQSNFAEFWIDA